MRAESTGSSHPQRIRLPHHRRGDERGVPDAGECCDAHRHWARCRDSIDVALIVATTERIVHSSTDLAKTFESTRLLGRFSIRRRTASRDTRWTSSTAPKPQTPESDESTSHRPVSRQQATLNHDNGPVSHVRVSSRFCGHIPPGLGGALGVARGMRPSVDVLTHTPTPTHQSMLRHSWTLHRP